MKVNPVQNKIPEVIKFISGIKNKKQRDQYSLIWKIGVNYCLRANEILSLTLNQAKSGRLKQPKTGKTKDLRYLPELISLIEVYCKKYKLTGDSVLFYGYKSQPLSYQGLEFMLKKLGKAIGEKTGTHSLRKTGARIIYDKTKDTVFATQLLGHRDFGSMLAYVGITDEEFQAKSKQIGLI